MPKSQMNQLQSWRILCISATDKVPKKHKTYKRTIQGAFNHKHYKHEFSMERKNKESFIMSPLSTIGIKRSINHISKNRHKLYRTIWKNYQA